jgi:hypothetical protein
MSTTIRQQTEYKQSAIDLWRDKYDAFVKDYIWLKGTYDVTKEEFASIVFALRNSYPYISPAELVELIQMYGNMKSGITGMLGTYPIS